MTKQLSRTLLKKYVCLTGLLAVSFASNSEPRPKSHIGWLGIDFQSSVGTEYGYNDNITYEAHEDDAIRSDYLRVTPELKLIGERYTDKYELSYSGDYTHYTSSSDDDYFTHKFNAYAETRVAYRHQFTMSVVETLDNEARGTIVSEGFSPEQLKQYGINSPIRKNSFYGELRYIYGSENSRGKLHLSFLHNTLDYKELDDIKNAEVDYYQYIKDQNSVGNSATVELFDQVTRDTRMRYSLINNRRNYDKLEKNNVEYFALIGINHKITGKSELDFNLAWLYKNWKNESYAEPFSGLNWQGRWVWMPVEHSNFTFRTWQQVRDPNEGGGYVLETNYGVAWKHYWWVDRFYTSLDFSHIDLNHKNQESNRHDKLYQPSVALGYDFGNSVFFQLKYAYSKLDSNLDEDYMLIGENNSRKLWHSVGYEQSFIAFTLKVQI